MAQPVILEYETDPTGDTWAELTGAVRIESLHMGGVADSSGAGTGFGFDFEDPAAAFALPARRRVRLWLYGVGDLLLAAGRITDKGVARRSPPVGDVRGFDVNLADRNSDLQGIEVHRWVRPAETDVERITALADTFLSGDPRVSTNLTQAYLSASNPVDLAAKTYDATNPAGVVADVCGQTRKLFFINQWGDIIYDAEDSTAYSAAAGVDLTVADDQAEVTTGGSFVFNPIFAGAAGTQDGTELYTGLTGLWDEYLSSVSDSDGTAEAAHDYWRETVYLNARDETAATAELSAILDDRKAEEERFSFAILVPDDPSGLIGFGFGYGHTFSFRAAAAGVLTPVVVRASRVTWSLVRPGLWKADIEAGFPRKLAPRLSRGTSRDTQPVPVGTGPSGGYNPVCADLPDSWAEAGVVGFDQMDVTFLFGDITMTALTGQDLSQGIAYQSPDPTLPVSIDRGELRGRVLLPVLGADVQGTGGATVSVFLNDALTAGLQIVQTRSPAAVKYKPIGGASETTVPVTIDGEFRYRLLVLSGLTYAKVWPLLEPEPADWTGPGTSAALTEVRVVTVFGPAVTTFAIDYDVLVYLPTWCDFPPAPVAFAGQIYRAHIATSDGTTAEFSLPTYPGTGYVSGTLQVYVDGVWQPVTESSVSPPGSFELGAIPDDGDEIDAVWRLPA